MKTQSSRSFRVSGQAQHGFKSVFFPVAIAADDDGNDELKQVSAEEILFEQDMIK